MGADAGGPLARRLLDLTDPELDFCDLARGMGVPARRVENAEDLVTALEAGFAEAGPTAHRGAALRRIRCSCGRVNAPDNVRNAPTTKRGPRPRIGSNGSIAPEKRPVTMHFEEGRLDETTRGRSKPRRAQMQMEMDSHPSSDARSIDAALERLRRDLFGHPGRRARSSRTTDEPDRIDYASLEFEVERMRKRLAIWEIFMAYMRDGARSWPEVQRSLTKRTSTRSCPSATASRCGTCCWTCGRRGKTDRTTFQIDVSLTERLCRSWRRPSVFDSPKRALDRAAAAALGDGQALSKRADSGGTGHLFDRIPSGAEFPPVRIAGDESVNGLEDGQSDESRESKRPARAFGSNGIVTSKE